MTPQELLAHKGAPKNLSSTPTFSQLKRGRLEKPFDRVGGSSIFSTGLIEVSSEHLVHFLYKDGQLLTDTQFLAWLMCRLHNGALSPIFEFHWHPSHKGFHCKTPCRTQYDYTGRTLPGAPELALKTEPQLDPRLPSDRLALIEIFCHRCGIGLDKPGAAPQQGKLQWK